MQTTEPSEKTKAILQRIMIDRLYPKRYVKYLFDQYFKCKDTPTRICSMSKPVTLKIENGTATPEKFIRRMIAMPENVKQVVEIITRNNFGQIIEYFQSSMENPSLDSLFQEILPRLNPDDNSLYKLIDPIWVSAQDDIFSVSKPYMHSPPSEMVFYTTYRQAICMCGGILASSVPHILKLQRLNNINSQTLSIEATDNGNAIRITFNKSSNIVITNVRRNQAGYVIVEGKVESPYITDFSQGGGNKSDARERAINVTSTSTCYATYLASLIAIGIIGIASIVPR